MKNNSGRDDFLIKLVLGASAVAVIIGVVVWWHVNYYCAEERDATCSTTDCTYRDGNGHCETWNTRTYTCKECLRWEKRRKSALPAEDDQP